MASYPRAFELAPIIEWPGELTSSRQVAKFRSASYRDEKGVFHNSAPTKLSKTMQELTRELDAINGTDPVLSIAVTRDQLRLDGQLRAGAQPWHPGIILAFDTPGGQMRYPSDYYTRWEDNLRAIVLTLDALRALERWHVTHGQQYGGFLAIESGIALGSRQAFTRASAIRLLWETAGEDIADNPLSTGDVLRMAKRAAHPDQGGDPETFQSVMEAEKFLRADGYL